MTHEDNQPETVFKTVFKCGCTAVVTSDFTIRNFIPFCDQVKWRRDTAEPTFAMFATHHLVKQVLERGSGEPLYAAALEREKRLSAEYDAYCKEESKTKAGAIKYAVLHNKRIAHYRWGTAFVSKYGGFQVAFAWKAWALMMALFFVMMLIERSCNVLK